MKFKSMKIDCPVCQERIREVRRRDDEYWTECPNQCAKLKYLKTGQMAAHWINVHIDGKDYRYASYRVFSIGSTELVAIANSMLNIYKYNEEDKRWEYKEIMRFHRYTEWEEVAKDPKRFVQRFLNVKVFA
jgi:hypothetical protein